MHNNYTMYTAFAHKVLLPPHIISGRCSSFKMRAEYWFTDLFIYFYFYLYCNIIDWLYFLVPVCSNFFNVLVSDFFHFLIPFFYYWSIDFVFVPGPDDHSDHRAARYRDRYHSRWKRDEWNQCTDICGSTGEKHTLYPYIAGIDFRRQNLTSVDVRYKRLMSIPAL